MDRERSSIVAGSATNIVEKVSFSILKQVKIHNSGVLMNFDEFSGQASEEVWCGNKKSRCGIIGCSQ